MQYNAKVLGLFSSIKTFKKLPVRGQGALWHKCLPGKSKVMSWNPGPTKKKSPQPMALCYSRIIMSSRSA